jgi:hypothetical protein
MQVQDVRTDGRLPATTLTVVRDKAADQVMVLIGPDTPPEIVTSMARGALSPAEYAQLLALLQEKLRASA